MISTYVLNNDGVPVAEPDLVKWAQWCFGNDDNCIVAKETIGEYRVSTVFLGVDHSFSCGGPPVLWETMVFGGKLDLARDRCSGSKEQAEAMHARMVQKVKNYENTTSKMP